MKWLRGRSMRRLTDEVFEKIRDEFAVEEVAKTIALAIGYAHHPGEPYGEELMDRMLDRIKGCPFTPCDPKTAVEMLEPWKRGSLSFGDAFAQIWGMTIEDFVKRLLKSEGVSY